MSGFGLMPKSSDMVPMGAVVKPGSITPLPLQGSLLGQTDSQNNALDGVVISDILREMALSGQAYRAHFQQTIGGAAQGWYGMALYNASNSGKSVLVTAVRGWIAGNAPLMYAFKGTTNPALANTATSVNDDFAISASPVATVTYNSASGGISFPGTMNIATIQRPSNETVVLQNERGFFAYLPSGTALSLEVVMFVVNSAQYGIQFEWSEL
jgi:hypothetical protein